MHLSACGRAGASFVSRSVAPKPSHIALVHRRAVAAAPSKPITRVAATMQQSAPPSKRAKINGSGWEHRVGSTYYVTGLQLTDHTMRVPLDHTGERRGGQRALPPPQTWP